MHTFRAMRAALALLGVAAPTGAHAAMLGFTGSLSATASVAADMSCAPLSFRGTVLAANSVGHSSFGDFTYSHSVCNAGAAGPVTGLFAINFGADGFSGLLDGMASASGTPGLFNQAFNYTITSGTGRFLGALGSFTGTGTVDARNPPSRLNLSFQGLVDAPAVPEPASWVLSIAGFGLAGWSLRRRARAAALRPARPYRG